MRILLIGASGYLGGHVRRAAASGGVTVVASSSSASSFAGVRIDLVADPVDRIGQVVAATAPDAIVNCAGATSGDAGPLSAANVTAVRGLLAAMVRLPSPPRLVHIGSAAEYGPGTPGIPVTESADPSPTGLYGTTKLAGTRLVELGRAAGLDAVSLRVFNMVGAGAPENTLPGTAAAQLRRLPAGTTESLMLGSLDGVRDFVDARDVAAAVLAASAAPGPLPAVINIGSGVPETSRALIQHLIEASGRQATVREEAPGSARSPATSWQQADIALAERALGWRPRRDLKEAVRDLWEGSCAA
jgi:nucleoside-diphosphate-sugar epimerase